MSKQTEAIKALRDMTDAELGDHLRQQRRHLFELRFQQATGQVENHRQIRDTRREIARTMTVQIEIEKGIVHLAPQVRPAPVVAQEERPRRRRRRAEPEAAEADMSLSETEPSPAEVDEDE